jgi:hypothetical protein
MYVPLKIAFHRPSTGGGMIPIEHWSARIEKAKMLFPPRMQQAERKDPPMPKLLLVGDAERRR